MFEKTVSPVHTQVVELSVRVVCWLKRQQVVDLSVMVVCWLNRHGGGKGLSRRSVTSNLHCRS